MERQKSSLEHDSIVDVQIILKINLKKLPIGSEHVGLTLGELGGKGDEFF